MEPKDLINSVYEAFQKGDIPFIVSQVAPGCVWKQSPNLPWGGEFSGPEGAGEFFTRLNDAYETTSFVVEESVQSGDEVFSVGSYAGTARATGKPGGTPFAFRWRVSNGKITFYEAYMDTVALTAPLS